MTKATYDTDFYAWTQEQAALLRAKAWEQLDLDNLAEEVEALGKSDRRAVQSHLVVLLQHLLKWTYQPQQRERYGGGWQASIDEARTQVELILQDSPSLQRELPAFVVWAYPRARRKAHRETGLPLAAFPETYPWRLEQILEEDFWPEG